MGRIANMDFRLHGAYRASVDRLVRRNDAMTEIIVNASFQSRCSMDICCKEYIQLFDTHRDTHTQPSRHDIQ